MIGYLIKQVFNMKAVVFLCIIISASLKAQNVPLSGKQMEKVKIYIEQCAKESWATLEIISEAKMGKFADDEGLKKFILCFFQKAGIISPEGKLNVDVALAKLPVGIEKDFTAKILKECKNRKGSTIADTAFEMYKCYYSNSKQRILYD